MKNIALVLGGTNAHIGLISRLKDRGYYTVLIDYFPNPLAREYADEHIRESTLDCDAVLQIAKKCNVKLVISACVDQANATACFVAEKLGLPAPYSYQTALAVTDKCGMKEKMNKAGILTSSYVVGSEDYIPNISNLSFPLIVKPVDSNGSKGVSTIRCAEHLESSIKRSLSVSRSKSYVIEEYQDGINIDFVSFIRNGEAFPLIYRYRQMIHIDGLEAIQYYRSLIPAPISDSLKKLMKNVATRIAEVFDIDNTPLEVQFIVVGDKAYVIEFAPRVGGGLSFTTVPLVTGFDILDATIGSYYGIQPILNRYDSQKFYSENNLYVSGGQFSKISMNKSNNLESFIDAFFCYKRKGDLIGQDLASKDRVGAFIASDTSIDGLNKKLAHIISNIDVKDLEDKSIFRRDIYRDIQCHERSV